MVPLALGTAGEGAGGTIPNSNPRETKQVRKDLIGSSANGGAVQHPKARGIHPGKPGTKYPLNPGWG